MTTFPMRLTVIVLALSFATVAQGQSDNWYVAPAIVFTDDDGDRNIDDSLAGGQISVGRNISEFMSLELLLGYSKIDGIFDDESHLDVSAKPAGLLRSR